MSDCASVENRVFLHKQHRWSDRIEYFETFLLINVCGTGLVHWIVLEE